MLMESSARLAHLADTSVTTIARVCRNLNETVFELNHLDNHMKDLELPGTSEEAKAEITAELREKRKRISDWASQRSIPILKGGFLNEPRANPQKAVQLCLEDQAKRIDSGGYAASDIGRWWYHRASSASHLLPDGLNSLVMELDHASGETGFGISRALIADATDWAFHCLLEGHEAERAYWGWPQSTDVKKAALAVFDCLRRLRS
jgi:hypothetical protein